MSFTNDKRPFAFDQDVNINAAIHFRDAASTLFPMSLLISFILMRPFLLVLEVLLFHNLQDRKNTDITKILLNVSNQVFILQSYLFYIEIKFINIIPVNNNFSTWIIKGKNLSPSVILQSYLLGFFCDSNNTVDAKPKKCIYMCLM